MGSWFEKDWYPNRGCVAVAVPSITSRGQSRGTVTNLSITVEETKEYIGNGPKRAKCWRIYLQPQLWLYGVLQGRGQRGTSSNAGTFRKASVFRMLCWCRPWWKCYHKALELWNIVVCKQCLNQVLQKSPKHSRVKYVWLRAYVLEIARDMIVEIIIKLKMFGVPLTWPENIFCNGNGVVKSTRIPQCTLSKNHNTVNYHCVCEESTAGILRVGN